MLVQQVRVQQGHSPKPNAAILDSRSVKTSEGGEARGVDVHKQTPGRKRHVVVDTLSLLLLVVVHSASIQDGTDGKPVLQCLFALIKRNVHNRWCRLKLSWADGGCKNIEDLPTLGWTLEIVRRPREQKGFVLLSRRRVVERTFGSL